MARRLIASSLGLIVAIVLVPPHVAAAKGTLITHALVSGPGISSDLKIDGDDADQLLPMWQGAWWPGPPSSLGPRYEIHWVFDYAPPAGLPASMGHVRRGVILVEFYPFAKGGPWARVPLGQHDIGGFVTIDHEWYSMPFGSLDVLRQHGFRAPPSMAPTKDAPTTKGSGPWRSSALQVVAISLALALLLMAVFTRHHGRRRRLAKSTHIGRPANL